MKILPLAMLKPVLRLIHVGGLYCPPTTIQTEVPMDKQRKVNRYDFDASDLRLLNLCEENLRKSIETDLFFEFENGIKCDKLEVKARGFYESGTPYIIVDLDGSFVDPHGETQPISSIMEFWFNDECHVVAYERYL